MWFTVYVYLRSSRPLPSGESLWMENLYLVSADEASSAKDLAWASAVRDEHRYKNLQGETGEWTADHLGAVHEVIASGVELHSRFLRSSQVEGLGENFDIEG